MPVAYEMLWGSTVAATVKPAKRSPYEGDIRRDKEMRDERETETETDRQTEREREEGT